MSEATDKLSQDQSLKIPGVPSKALEGFPMWIKAAFVLLSMIGIPGGMVAVREARDWRFEDRRIQLEEKRLEVDRERIKEDAKHNVMLEQLGRVLRSLERKLPADSSGGADR